MHLAVLADVHANLPALEAVLADVDRVTPAGIWVAGDLVGYNPWPNEVLQILRDRRMKAIRGTRTRGPPGDSWTSRAEPSRSAASPTTSMRSRPRSSAMAYRPNWRIASTRACDAPGSDPLRVDGPLATDLSRVHGRLRLEEQDVHLLIGYGTMFRSPWDHRELTLQKGDRTVRQLDPEATLQHVEELVLPRMVVPDELALELHQFHVRIVQLGDDLRLPIVADSIQFRAKIHRRYWFLRFLRHPVASLFPRKRRTRLRIMKDWPRFRIVSLSASRPSGGGTA